MNETWKTQDGRVLLISEMDDDHLCNTIRYLRRRVRILRDSDFRAGESMLAFVQGEAATDSVLNTLNLLEGLSDEEYLMQRSDFRAMIEELAKRKLREKALFTPVEIQKICLV